MTTDLGASSRSSRPRLCHISELSDGYVNRVADVCKAGDIPEVQAIAIDDHDRVKPPARFCSTERRLTRSGGAGPDERGQGWVQDRDAAIEQFLTGRRLSISVDVPGLAAERPPAQIHLRGERWGLVPGGKCPLRKVGPHLNTAGTKPGGSTLATTSSAPASSLQRYRRNVCCCRSGRACRHQKEMT